MTTLSDEGLAYRFGPQLRRDAQVRAYAIDGNRPKDWRVLWVYAVDASLSQEEGERDKVRVPFEKCSIGPRGGLFVVDTYCPAIGRHYRRARLDDPEMLRNRGVMPDESDTRFHCQMAYAMACLTYEAFRDALGRMPGWAFDARDGQDFAQLTLMPFAMEERNAYYSRSDGCIRFGYFQTDKGDAPDYPPGKTIFSTLSGDIVAHEVGHAILDGLRPHFAEVTGPDVPAFHEAFSDLLAIFQRFRFRKLIRAQIAEGNGTFPEDGPIGKLAPEFGAAAMFRSGSIRQYIVTGRRGERPPGAGQYDPSVTCPHERGAVLAGAVLDAFFEILRKRVRPLIRIRTGGRDTLEKGELSADLLDQMTYQIQRIAAQFRAICIRAIDYCPPIDIDFGDYLRALVTADHVAVANDRFGYREAIIDAFRRRGIYPASVPTMSETALLWNAPRRPCRRLEALSLQNLAFRGDPGDAPDLDSVAINARKLGDAIMDDPNLYDEIGLNRPGDHDHDRHGMGRPQIASLRATRRSGPDGQITFDLIAEIVQSGWTDLPDGRRAPLRNGATLILDETGAVRFIIRKRMTVGARHEAFETYLSGEGGGRYWQDDGRGRLRMHDGIFARLCGREENEAAEGSRDLAAGSWIVAECDEVAEGTKYTLELDETLDMLLGVEIAVQPTGNARLVLVCEDGRCFSWEGEIPPDRSTPEDAYRIALAPDDPRETEDEDR